MLGGVRGRGFIAPSYSIVEELREVRTFLAFLPHQGGK